MCDYEADYSVEEYDETDEIAKALTICDGCHGAIPAGAPTRACWWLREGEDFEEYIESDKPEGFLETEHLCEACALAFDYFKHTHHHAYPCPNGFWSAVRECFHGADKDDPDAMIWRGVFAGMKRRRRSRQRAGIPLNPGDVVEAEA